MKRTRRRYLTDAHWWLGQDPDPRTRAELTRILDDLNSRDPVKVTRAEAELADRFGGKLEFGTAGLRGALGAGPARMNRVTVMRATAGLVAWLGASGARDASHSRNASGVSGTPRGTVVVGYDARHMSDVFARDTAAVLTGAGLSVLVLPRPLPTPVLAFAVRHLTADAGVMITASHNPPADNGYKVYARDGAQIAPPADAEISAAIDAAGSVADLPLGDGGQILGDEIVQAYLTALAGLPLGDSRDVRVVYTPLHGVGAAVLVDAFTRTGFPPPVVVAAQATPDPDFPTVVFPNPEESGAMDLALAAGARAGADLVLANDPDADRCAAAVGGRMLSGDELGGLLAEHVLRHTCGSDRLVATTIVSSSLLEKIAKASGVRYAETLTGFKWIVRAPAAHPDGGRLVFGYEEALGYCVGSDAGPPVWDKDGIGAALAVASLTACAARSGRTLDDLLNDQARRYGLHATRQLSFRVKDMEIIRGAMRRLRAGAPGELAGRAVVETADLAQGLGHLPPADVLRYRLAGNARVVIRPSGTEPKLKVYLEVVVPVTSDTGSAREIARVTLDTIAADIPAVLGI